jgi:hypothetical protein
MLSRTPPVLASDLNFARLEAPFARCDEDDLSLAGVDQRFLRQSQSFTQLVRDFHGSANAGLQQRVPIAELEADFSCPCGFIYNRADEIDDTVQGPAPIRSKLSASNCTSA